jgi:plasmid stabilization system protein ParE
VIYRVVFTPRARADAVQAFRRMAEDAPTAAGRWYVGLNKAIAKLRTMPELHPVAEEESERIGITLRQMLYGRRRNVWRILFSIDGDRIYLHYVRHSAQDVIEP